MTDVTIGLENLETWATEADMRRIGLLGGTFDPPHLGHLTVADQVLERLALDSIWLVVANEPWQKAGTRKISPAGQRLQLAEAAVSASANRVEVSDVEIRIGGPSFTSVTLEVLSDEHPDTEWLVVVGSDAAGGLDTWHEAEKLRRQATFVVVDRPGAAVKARPPAGFSWVEVDIPSLDISSTEVRQMITDKRSVRHLLPDSVIDLVERWQLYSPAE